MAVGPQSSIVSYLTPRLSTSPASIDMRKSYGTTGTEMSALRFQPSDWAWTRIITSCASAGSPKGFFRQR
jgi:hypothetical protein